MEIRHPTPDDRAAISELEGLAFNFDQPPENIDVARKLCAYEGTTVIATASSHAFRQWFGGRSLACSGVAGVAVLPEHRGNGVARRLVSELMAHRRRQGDVVSALYPANSRLYRRVGYEYGGLRPHFSAPVTDFPKVSGDPTSIMVSGDLPAVRDCFEEMARHHNGVIGAVDPAHWERRVLAQAGDGVKHRTVLARGAGGSVTAYATYYTSPWQDAGYGVHCKHLFATTAQGLAGILGYLRSMENSAREVTWTGPLTSSPVGMALTSTTSSLQVHWQRWMSRILDVPAALEGRGYPPAAEARLVLAVDDPVLPENNGPWLVEVAGGGARVSPSGEAAAPLSIGALSALYTGMAGVEDLVLLGLADAGDPSLRVLSSIFAGPAPWTPDFF